MQVENRILYLQWELLTIKRKINSKIRKLPDNSKIKRISMHPNCFIINSSTIMSDKNKNMSPYYYDFKCQYKEIVNKLKASNPFDLYKVLNKMIIEKSFHVYAGHNIHNRSCVRLVILHEKVVEYLKTLI